MGVATPKGRTAALTIALLMAAMLALTVALRVANRGELQAHRVVVVASGCGAECSDVLARALAESLRSLGFDAAVPDTPRAEPFETPAAARAFARARGARSAVMIALAIEDSAALADGGARISANATLYVMDAAQNAAPHPLQALRSVEDGDDEQGALALIARHTLQGLFASAADALLSLNAVAALQAGATGLEQQAAALALGRQQRALESRRVAMREYAMYCQANRARLAVERGECVSDGCAREYAVALLPDASAAIVHDNGDLAIFPLEISAAPRRLATSERLWLVPRAGRRELLAEAADFEARPDLSRDGRVLAFVEQRRGHSALYALPLATRERRLIAAAAAPRRVTAPRVSPDGTHVLFYVRDAKRRRSALRIARTSGDEPARTLLKDATDARWVELAATPDAPARLWIAALARGGAPPRSAGAEPSSEPTLLLLDATTGAIVVRQPLTEHTVRALGDDVADGALLLSWQDQACGFARFRPGLPIEWHATPLCPKHIAAGKAGVFAHARVGAPTAARQLVRIDPVHGELEPLTPPALDAQSPRPAADAERLAYERVAPRTYGELQHVAVCIDDVAQVREREREPAAVERNTAASSSESNVSAVCRGSRGRNKPCH